MAADLVSMVLAGAGGSVGVACAIVSARAFGNARLLENAVPTAIEALDESLHEVAGRLSARGPLLAPLTGRPCAWYRLLLKERRRNRWETLLDQKGAVATGIADDTGAVDVALAEADVVVSSPERVRTGIFTVPSAELDALLATVSAPSRAPAGPFLRWREEILLDGDRVFGVGVAARSGDGWALGAAGNARVLVSDREEAEVVRHQRRAGQRWAALATLALLVAGYGTLGLLG